MLFCLCFFLDTVLGSLHIVIFSIVYVYDNLVIKFKNFGCGFTKSLSYHISVLCYDVMCVVITGKSRVVVIVLSFHNWVTVAPAAA